MVVLQAFAAMLWAAEAGKPLRLGVHGAVAEARVSSVRSSADRLCISVASCWSSGSAIMIQATVTGAFTGTSTAWNARPSHSAMALAWPSRAAISASRCVSGCSACGLPAVAARKWKSVPSKAASVAPMRAPWWASTETMVCASFELSASRKP